MDDFTLGGPSPTMASDVITIKNNGTPLGFHLNPHKCEIISFSYSARRILPLYAGLGYTVGRSLHDWCRPGLRSINITRQSRIRAVDRLQLISAYDALLLFNNCLSSPKLIHVLRTTPCHDHPQLHEFDTLFTLAVSKIFTVALSDDQWTHATLPVGLGGHGVRSMSMLASSAFMAFAAGMLPLPTTRSNPRTTSITEPDIWQQQPRTKDMQCLSRQVGYFYLMKPYV
jgi:hypothetical protein